jgi:hypothetical protein
MQPVVKEELSLREMVAILQRQASSSSLRDLSGSQPKRTFENRFPDAAPSTPGTWAAGDALTGGSTGIVGTWKVWLGERGSNRYEGGKF